MKKSYIIGELEVLSYNIDPQKDWVDAKKSCEDLGEGWRLPTIKELGLLFKYYEMGVMGFSLGENSRSDDFIAYWSSEIDADSDESIIHGFFMCKIFYFRTFSRHYGVVDWEPGLSPGIYYSVRPVRTV